MPSANPIAAQTVRNSHGPRPPFAIPTPMASMLVVAGAPRQGGGRVGMRSRRGGFESRCLIRSAEWDLRPTEPALADSGLALDDYALSLKGG